MINEGQFIVHIEGKKGCVPLSPDNFDITMLHEILGYVKDLLKQEKGTDTPTVLSGIENGSVKGLFKTSKENAVKISAVLSMLAQTPMLDQFEPSTSRAFEGFQSFAVRYDVRVGLSTSVNPDKEVSISPTTNLHRTNDMWVDTEVYLYGKIMDAGGVTKTNVHLQTDIGNVKIEASEEEIVSIKENPLYKMYGIRAKGKQNVITGEIDRRSLRFLNIIDYNPSYDEAYLNSKIEKATPTWRGIDIKSFLHEIREGVYA